MHKSEMSKVKETSDEEHDNDFDTIEQQIADETNWSKKQNAQDIVE